MDIIPETTELLPFFKRLEPQMLQWLAALINLDTPSNQKPALDALGQRLATQFQECGARDRILGKRGDLRSRAWERRYFGRQEF